MLNKFILWTLIVEKRYFLISYTVFYLLFLFFGVLPVSGQTPGARRPQQAINSFVTALSALRCPWQGWVKPNSVPG